MKRMYHSITMLCVFLACGMQARSDVVVGAVGTQRLTIARPGERYQAVSIPFLKPSEYRGRFDGIYEEGGDPFLLDDDNFPGLSSLTFYFVRITSGPQRGRVCSAIVSSGTVEGSFRKLLQCYSEASSIDFAELEGTEAFSVHEGFYLSDWFPNDGSVVSAGAIEMQATRVLVFWDGAYRTYWLSDGTHTNGTRGWVTGDDSGNTEVFNDVGLLPGEAFLIEVPNVVEPIEIQVSGEVLMEPIVHPLQQGFNLLGVLHNLSRTDLEGSPSVALIDSGLAESGFASRPVDETGGDQLSLFDPSTQAFDSVFVLREAAGAWHWEATQGTPTTADDQPIEPGAALSVYREGEPLRWEVGK